MGILYVAKGVPYQLNVKWRPSVRFVVRRFGIQCGFLNLEYTSRLFLSLWQEAFEPGDEQMIAFYLDKSGVLGKTCLALILCEHMNLVEIL